MDAPTVRLTGRVYVDDEGFYVCHIEQISQTFHDKTFQAVVQFAYRIAIEYFEVCQQRGTFESELLRLGVTTDAGIIPDVHLVLDVRAIFGSPTQASVTMTGTCASGTGFTS